MTAMVTAHEHLEKTRTDFRMPEVAAGGLYEKPAADLVKGNHAIVPTRAVA